MEFGNGAEVGSVEGGVVVGIGSPMGLGVAASGNSKLYRFTSDSSSSLIITLRDFGLDVGGERVGGESFFVSSSSASVTKASKFKAAAFSSSSVCSGLHSGQRRLSLTRNQV